MNETELLQNVDPKWHQALLTFIETGEAEPGFLEALEKDENIQQAVDRAFTEQASAFEALARSLPGGRTETAVSGSGLRASRSPLRRGQLGQSLVLPRQAKSSRWAAAAPPRRSTVLRWAAVAAVLVLTLTGSWLFGEAAGQARGERRLAAFVERENRMLRQAGRSESELAHHQLELDAARARLAEAEKAVQKAAAPGSPDSAELAALRAYRASAEERIRVQESTIASLTEKNGAAASDSRLAKVTVGPPLYQFGTPGKVLQFPQVVWLGEIDYPRVAELAGIEGTVFVDTVIDEKGQPVSTRAQSSTPALKEAALTSVQNGKFRPGKEDGEVARMQIRIPIFFRLPPPAIPSEAGPAPSPTASEPPP